MDSTTLDLQNILARASTASFDELRDRHGLPSGSSPAALAAEICADGGSTVANFFRGGGVAYGEIVGDVADFLGVKPSGNAGDLAALEQQILDNVWQRYLKSATPEELVDLGEMAEREGRRAQRNHVARAVIVAAGTQAAAHIVLQTLGRQLFWNLLRTQVLPRVGVIAAARIAIAGPAAVLGPVGWVLGGAAVLYECDKPAMRKLLPTVLQVACLRGAVE
jgi:uncharacterized protein YaaW (UPF0174 family)